MGLPEIQSLVGHDMAAVNALIQRRLRSEVSLINQLVMVAADVDNDLFETNSSNASWSGSVSARARTCRWQR